MSSTNALFFSQNYFFLTRRRASIGYGKEQGKNDEKRIPGLSGHGWIEPACLCRSYRADRLDRQAAKIGRFQNSHRGDHIAEIAGGTPRATARGVGSSGDAWGATGQAEGEAEEGCSLIPQPPHDIDVTGSGGLPLCGPSGRGIFLASFLRSNCLIYSDGLARLPHLIRSSSLARF